MIESRLIAHAQTRNRTLYQHSHPQLLLSLEEGSSLALPALQRDKPGNALTDLHRQRQELTVLVIFSLSDGTGMLKTFYSSTGGASALQGQVGPPFSRSPQLPQCRPYRSLAGRSLRRSLRPPLSHSARPPSSPTPEQLS